MPQGPSRPDAGSPFILCLLLYSVAFSGPTCHKRQLNRSFTSSTVIFFPHVPVIFVVSLFCHLPLSTEERQFSFQSLRSVNQYIGLEIISLVPFSCVCLTSIVLMILGRATIPSRRPNTSDTSWDASGSPGLWDRNTSSSLTSPSGSYKGWQMLNVEAE